MRTKKSLHNLKVQMVNICIHCDTKYIFMIKILKKDLFQKERIKYYSS